MDLVPLKKHSLTPAQFEQLADVPPEDSRQGQIRHSNGNVRVVPAALDDDIPAAVNASLLLGGHKSIASLSGVRRERILVVRLRIHVQQTSSSFLR